MAILDSKTGKAVEYNLRIPGPTPLPDAVREAVSQQMISHRGKAYEEIHSRVVEDVKYFLQTKNDVFLITSSGMGGLEAAVVNFFSAGDQVLSLTCGEFGSRWADVARAFGLNVTEEKFAPGKAVDSVKAKELLAKNLKFKGVFITLNETSTGVLNPVAKLAKLIQAHPAKPLILIDGISGLGGVDLPVDAIGVDVAVSATQKAWMSPPGLSLICVSKSAWERHNTVTLPRYYFDLSQFKEFSLKNQTPATPAVGTLYGLDAALQMMKNEGREKVFARHLRLRDYTRKNVKALGFKLMAEDGCASPTVTSFWVPEGKDGKAWLTEIKEKYKIILTGGMGELKEKIIRIAHMGWTTEADLDPVFKALKDTK
jgi:aspartate aminotransferase-like enzyme